ncbi:MAG: glycosyltransferase family 9 protein [Candidatus Gastranaerophilales bacterium]|nr:glycosyltransferase family 9 protein [Candidatus Gastranaerophilales bacterium]
MKNYKNVLFINYGGIGDEILFLPTITAFKKQYPDCKITLALEARSTAIKDLTTLIDEVITVDIKAQGVQKYINALNFILKVRKKGFDCVISSGKNPLVAVILFLTGIKERAGYSGNTDFLLTKKVKLNENQYAGKMYHDLLKPFNITEYNNPEINAPDTFETDNFIAIHPGVSKMSVLKGIYKCPDAVFWRSLIKSLLLIKNKKVLLLGSEDDKDLVCEILQDSKIINNSNFINYFNKTKNIMQMASIMKKAQYVICVDSAPLHVACALKAKVFAIFGPTNEEKLVPKSENITIVTNNCDCRPCLWHKRSRNCEESDCLKIDYNLILDKIN